MLKVLLIFPDTDSSGSSDSESDDASTRPDDLLKVWFNWFNYLVKDHLVVCYFCMSTAGTRNI